jgi:hypothetical protein
MTNKTIYHIEAHKKGWAVRKQGVERPSKVEEEKNDAISKAHDLTENQLPAEIVIHGRRGKVLDRIEKEVKKSKGSEVTA